MAILQLPITNKTHVEFIQLDNESQLELLSMLNKVFEGILLKYKSDKLFNDEIGKVQNYNETPLSPQPIRQEVLSDECSFAPKPLRKVQK